MFVSCEARFHFQNSELGRHSFFSSILFQSLGKKKAHVGFIFIYKAHMGFIFLVYTLNPYGR